MFHIFMIDYKNIKKYLDYWDFLILKIVYNDETSSLNILEKRLKNYKISKPTISKKIKRLHDLELVYVIKKTKPLMVNSNYKEEENIKMCIVELKNKYMI